MRRADRARDVLREIPYDDLIAMAARRPSCTNRRPCRWATVPRAPDEFVHQQSATTGLPEHMCRANIAKNAFVLRNMRQILDCLTRGLPLDILSRGWGDEGRGVIVSYQATIPGAGCRTALQFARRAYALAAGHPAADRIGAEARIAGAVDALPDGFGLYRSRDSRARCLGCIPAVTMSAGR